MKKIIWKAYMDYEKEEAWLNKLSAQGLAFTNYFFFRYTFADCRPGEYVYRIELLQNSVEHAESKKYISFMAENGVEHIASWIRWVYFRKKAENGSFDIYSDIDSRLAHYRRIGALWWPLICLDLLLGISQFISGMNYELHGTNIGAFPFLFNGILLLCLGVIFFIQLIALRKKIKKLQVEKALRE